MTSESLPTNYEQNAVDLQNIQNQSNIQESSTWIEYGFWYFTHLKIINHVYEMSKVVSPQQTVRQIATYTVSPLAKRIDETRGFGNANIKVFGYKIPCSFSTLGTLATETLAITASPAQWAAYKTVNFISNSLASKLITELNLKNHGTLGREAAAAIQIGSSLFFQKKLEDVEKNEIVASTYKKVDSELEKITKPVDKFVHKQISNGLEKLGIDTDQPLGLTQTDIEREKKLFTSEEKVADIEEEIQGLKIQETKLQEQVAQQDKTAEQINLDADRIIKKAREHEKNCPEKESEPKYKKHKKFKKVWAKNISEQFVSEFNISEQQRSDIQDEVMRKLHKEHGEKAHNNAMKEVIVKHKAMLNNNIKIELNDVKRTHTKMECKLVKAKQQYKSEKDNFYKETNVYQQAKYEKEQQERNKIRSENSSMVINTNSGNVQFIISRIQESDELKELEKYLNQLLEENGYLKKNWLDKYDGQYDGKHKLFINGKCKIIPDSLGNLGLVVPVRIDNKRIKGIGKVTQFNEELYFNIQLADSSPEKLICISNMDATHKISKKPHFKLFSTFQTIRVGNRANEEFKLKFINEINTIQSTFESFFLKDYILSKISEKLPKEIIITPGIINARPRSIGNNQVFDIDFNADFQCQISADSLKDLFSGYSIGGCNCEKPRNIEMADGRVKVEIPLSGAVNGIIFGSMDLSYCPERQRFSFNNLEVTPQSSTSSIINIFSSGINCFPSFLSKPLENILNNNLQNIRLFYLNYVQQKVQEKIPGNLVIDNDSLTINNINCNNNNIILDISLRSNNLSAN